MPLLKTFFRGHVASLGPPDHDHHDGDGDIKEKVAKIFTYQRLVLNMT